MSDHLQLAPPSEPHRKRRTGFDPEAPPIRVSRSAHAVTIAGILAGLGLPHPGESLPNSGSELDEGEPEEDSRIVLVFSSRAALNTGPFRRWGMVPLTEAADGGMVVLTAAESRVLFARLVDQYGGDRDDWDNPDAWATQLDAVEGVRLYSREDRRDIRLPALAAVAAPIAIDVMLWPSTLERRTRREQVVADRIAEVRALVDLARPRNDYLRIIADDPRPETPMLRILVDETLLDTLLNHPLVERVSLPETATVTLADLAAVAPPTTPPIAAGAPIGVIDDLVLTNPYLDSSVVQQQSFPHDHPWRPATQHGTQVASIAAYGSLRELISRGAPAAPPHPIYSARILESDARKSGNAVVAGLFHRELENAVRWLHSCGVKIISCSVTTEVAATRAYPAEVTVALDQLARELDLVIVVAAGNRSDIGKNHWRDHYPHYLQAPDAAVAEPGTAVLAVTAGAIAWYDHPGARGALNQVPIARKGQPAPFTRTGPTKGTTTRGTLKPEFVAHGGNWSWDTQLGALFPNDPALGVITLIGGLRSGRLVGAAFGTSFAAPYVAHEAAQILTRYPGAGANLIRCFLALSAEQHPDHQLDNTIEQRTGAYGIPLAHRITESGPHRVVVTFEGTIPANQVLIHPIPIPPAFAAGRLGQTVTIALAYDPDVRRTRRAYQAATMDAELVVNMPLEDVIATFQEQPSLTAAQLDPTLIRRVLPTGHQRPNLHPGATAVESNTLIRRRLERLAWSPDDEGYHVVVRHDLQPWAKPGNDCEVTQRYALAVELRVNHDVNIDLYALVRAQLEGRARGRAQP